MGNDLPPLAEAAVERSFARHETFHPRYSWFRKANAEAAEDGSVVSRENAPVQMGVGKNVVWGHWAQPRPMRLADAELRQREE